MNTAATSQKVNLNTLSVCEKQDLIKQTYEAKSYFQDLYHDDFTELDTHAISKAFRNEIERILFEKKLVSSYESLEKLHEVLSPEMKAYNLDDGVNKISTFFYETDHQFIAVYHQFIKLLREHFLREAFWFQATPTIRIHCPNALNSHHYPRYHSDISYGHPPEEMNIWLPLTEIMEGHSFRIMNVSESNKLLEKFNYDFGRFIQNSISNKEFSKECDTFSFPVTTMLGKTFAFDSRCIHTGEPMQAHTRVSIDIRILPVSQYQKMNIEYQGSGRRKILFTPGHCYHEKDSDQLLTLTGI